MELTYKLEKRISKTSGNEILEVTFDKSLQYRKVIITNRENAEKQLGLLGRDLYNSHLKPDPIKTTLWEKRGSGVHENVYVQVYRTQFPALGREHVSIFVSDGRFHELHPWSSGWNSNDEAAATEIAKVLYDKLIGGERVVIGPDGFAYVEPHPEDLAYEDSFNPA